MVTATWSVAAPGCGFERPHPVPCAACVIPGDVTGADTVLCWQTGYPFAVNLSRGYPRYEPEEYSANTMLERGEVDACLLVGSEAVSLMSPEAPGGHLCGIPTIVLDYPAASCPLNRPCGLPRRYTASTVPAPPTEWMRFRFRCGRC